jgi:hypothetical protein
VSKFTSAWFAALVLAGLAAGDVRAQGVGSRPAVGLPPAGPTVSPYINLFRNGNTPAFNYYGLVRPQFQTNAGLQALQQQVLQTNGAVLPGGAPSDDVVVTGHAAVFMNLGGYFQSATGGLRANPVSSVGAAPPRSARPAVPGR